MKIFILSPNKDVLFDDSQIKRIEELGDTTFVTENKPFDEVTDLFEGDDERVLAIDPDFCDWKVSNEVLDRIPNLKAICLQTTSFSWIDVNHAKDLSIPVMNLRGFSSNAVAEWAIMMALNVARTISLSVQDGWQYDYTKNKGIELEGKTAGVIGLGSIGTKIAEKCKGLGMNVIYWSKSTRDDRFEYTELDDLMKNADVIFPAVAQNDETSSLLSDEMLRSMKNQAIFVSIVHIVYNQDIITERIKAGTLFGYANEEESETTATSEGNIWTGLQLGWCTFESISRNAEQWVQSIEKASRGDYETRVN